MIGRYDVPIDRVIAILVHHVLPINNGWKPVEQHVVELIRLPRTLQTILVGDALAVSGTALQGVFRNPLVGPQIVGVSSGTALGEEHLYIPVAPPSPCMKPSDRWPRQTRRSRLTEDSQILLRDALTTAGKQHTSMSQLAFGWKLCFLRI